jgi:hypothetical protein
MDSDVLLLSYLDKIWLIFTGEPGRALACLYCEARLHKGAREASLSQLTTPLSTGNISVREEKSATATHVEQEGLCSFPLKFTAAL